MNDQTYFRSVLAALESLTVKGDSRTMRQLADMIDGTRERLAKLPAAGAVRPVHPRAGLVADTDRLPPPETDGAPEPVLQASSRAADPLEAPASTDPAPSIHDHTVTTEGI